MGVYFLLTFDQSLISTCTPQAFLITPVFNVMFDVVNCTKLIMVNVFSVFPEAQNVVVFSEGWVERIQKEIAEYGHLPEPSHPTLDNLAYIVYSSGTTGKPKGYNLYISA